MKGKEAGGWKQEREGCLTLGGMRSCEFELEFGMLYLVIFQRTYRKYSLVRRMRESELEGKC